MIFISRIVFLTQNIFTINMHKRIKHIQNKIEMSDNKLPGSNEYEYLYLYHNTMRYDFCEFSRFSINIQMHMCLNQK